MSPMSTPTILPTKTTQNNPKLSSAMPYENDKTRKTTLDRIVPLRKAKEGSVLSLDNTFTNTIESIEAMSPNATM